MGFFRNLSNFLGLGRRNVDVIVVGLDNSGKTTILNQLKPPESRLTTIVPTMGYTVTHFTSENFNFNAFDMAGQSKYRTVWETYYAAAQAVIFVIDSSDRLRMAVARDELWMIFDHKDVANRQLPVLIFANKSDLPDSISAAEMTQCLGLDVVRGHPWHIVSCCAITGSGLEGMTKDLTPPTTECKPTAMAPLMQTTDQPYFSHFPFSFYPLADRNQMFSTTFDNLQQQVYTAGPGHRWPEAYGDSKGWMDPGIWAPAFPLAPPAMEPCPVDPCPSTVPSTSVAQPTFEYKPLDYMMGRAPVNTTAYQYPAMLPYTDFPQATAAITANWKAAAMKGPSNKANGIPPPKHRTGPGTNNVRVRTQDTYRVVYTDAQRTHLEMEYQSQPFITSERKAELSGRLNLTERQVKIWFQNRRAKDRREKRNTPSKQLI